MLHSPGNLERPHADDFSRVHGIGIDLCEIDRMEQLLQRLGDRFLRRAYGPDEISWIRSGSTAARKCAALFAAKEAVVKCLGTGFAAGVGWKQVEVIPMTSGPLPAGWMVRLNGEAERRAVACGEPRFAVSIHYTDEYAAAVAIWSGAG